MVMAIKHACKVSPLETDSIIILIPSNHSPVIHPPSQIHISLQSCVVVPVISIGSKLIEVS